MDEQGKQLNSYSYDIWGGPVETEETVPNVMRYAGEYWDDTTGLQYLRARWYDPGTARFMGEDTYEGKLTNPLSQNLYTYVHNNPLRYIDSSGHFAFETSDKVELKNLLDEAKVKSKSNRNNKYYKVYKDFIRDRYVSVDKNIDPLKVALLAAFLFYRYKFLSRAKDKNLYRLP